MNNLISKVFGWLCIGLLLTFFTGYYVSCNENTLAKIFSSGTFIVLVIVEVVLVLILSARAHKMQPTTAKIVFAIYSIVTGLTFSSIFVVYKLESIMSVFGIVACLFGVFAFLGYKTDIDLSKFGTFLFMMLIGIIVCSIVNIFLGNSLFDIVISSISIIVFLGYTFYDMAKIRELATYNDSDTVAIIGALELYLDFINLFIDLIRLIGSRKD